MRAKQLREATCTEHNTCLPPMPVDMFDEHFRLFSNLFICMCGFLCEKYTKTLSQLWCLWDNPNIPYFYNQSVRVQI